MSKTLYTKQERQNSLDAAFAFDNELRRHPGKILTLGEKRTFNKNKNVVLVSKIEGRPGPVMVSVSTLDRWLGEQMVATDDGFAMPEGKTIKIVDEEGRLAFVDAE